jgi:hypothetical protein
VIRACDGGMAAFTLSCITCVALDMSEAGTYRYTAVYCFVPVYGSILHNNTRIYYPMSKTGSLEFCLVAFAAGFGELGTCSWF